VLDRVIGEIAAACSNGHPTIDNNCSPELDVRCWMPALAAVDISS
jgi:hypothetical protein